MSPTQRQQDVLRFVRGYQLAKGCGPVLREIAEGIGVSAKSGIYYKLVALEERGLIERFYSYREGRNESREYEVLTDIPVPLSPEGEPLYFVRVGQ